MARGAALARRARDVAAMNPVCPRWRRLSYLGQDPFVQQRDQGLEVSDDGLGAGEDEWLIHAYIISVN